MTTMEPFKSILVDVDATASVHPALERAVDLARSSGAKLTIVDVMTVPPHERQDLPVGVEEAMIARRRQQLNALASRVTGIPTEAKLLAGRPATALIQEVLRSGHDVIMRSHARDLVAPGPKPFGAVDMELLRKCPCTVFLVRRGSHDQHRLVVGAVNARTQQPAEQALNTKIVEATLLIAGLEHGIPLLLHAWSPYGEATIRAHSTHDAYAVYVEEARRRTTDAFAQLTELFRDRLSGVRTVLRRGRPEDVIPEFVVAEGIDVVVMGTVARGGIAGLLIGNTAERLLTKLPCSVLAVKPDGFVSPVRLDVA